MSDDNILDVNTKRLYNMYIWDEKKRQTNIDKHGFDFVHVDQIIENKHVLLASQYNDEKRYLAVGKIEGRYATVIYTMRDTQYRVISIRSARHEERNAHKKLLGE